jgi:precorrin-8X/cobalt-precorrin-8 methylmutase
MINDPKIKEASRLANKTRSELAMREAAKMINEGVVIIGNAPTALYEVIAMIKERKVSPLLVIGIPVGFVSAVESKVDLSTLEVPFITNKGRKGGSSAASSIINSLMLMYLSKNR